MKIKNSFIKRTSIYFIGTLSTKMISVMLVPIYAYFVVVNDLSEYDYFATIASTLSPIAFAAIWEAILKYGIKKETDNKTLFSTAIIFTMAITILCILSYPIISFFIGASSGVFLVLLFIVAQGVVLIWQFSARALQENRRFVIASIVGSCVLIATDIILIYFKRLDFWGLSISYVLSQMAIAIVLETRLHLLRQFKLSKVSLKVLKQMLFFSLPLVVNNVSLWLYSSGSRIIIKNYIGVTENGLYAFASKFSLLISLVSMVISMAIIEEAYSYDTLEEYRDKISNLISIISKAYFAIIGLAIPAIYVLYSIAFKNTDYYASVDYIFLLLLGALFTALSNNFGSSFQVTNNTKYIFLTTIVGAAVALGTSLLLNQTLGVYGVLIGNAFGPFVMMLIRAIYAKRTTGLTINWLGNLRIFLVSCLEYVVLIAFDNIFVQIGAFIFAMIFLAFEYRREFVLLKYKLLHKETSYEKSTIN